MDDKKIKNKFSNEESLKHQLLNCRIIRTKNNQYQIKYKETNITINPSNNYIKNTIIEDINVELNDCRQTTAMSGRIPCAKSDQIRGNINKDTIRFNDRKMLYGYISTPGQSLNQSVVCNRTANLTNHKTNLNNNFYNIDPIFITTLNNNPLVNDLRHQKNY
jgi:hypothetical protein